MKKMNLHSLNHVALIAMALFFVSCGNTPQSPGIEYMPDMYRTPALEPYSGNSNYADSMEARKPVEGTIPRGFTPYGIPNTNEGYEKAGALLVNPFGAGEGVVAEGKEIYTKYCLHCHGKEGAGDGPTVTAGGHPPPPAYNSAALKTLPEGKMFHSITYGKNLMGSHSSQLTVEERWKVIRYVQTLQNPEGEEGAEGTEETNEEAPAAAEATSYETAMNN